MSRMESKEVCRQIASWLACLLFLALGACRPAVSVERTTRPVPDEVSAKRPQEQWPAPTADEVVALRHEPGPEGRLLPLEGRSYVVVDVHVEPVPGDDTRYLALLSLQVPDAEDEATDDEDEQDEGEEGEDEEDEDDEIRADMRYQLLLVIRAPDGALRIAGERAGSLSAEGHVGGEATVGASLSIQQLAPAEPAAQLQTRSRSSGAGFTHDETHQWLLVMRDRGFQEVFATTSTSHNDDESQDVTDQSWEFAETRTGGYRDLLVTTEEETQRWMASDQPVTGTTVVVRHAWNGTRYLPVETVETYGLSQP